MKLFDDSGVLQVSSGGSGSSGDVVGPASAVDDHIATFDGATGKLIQDGGSTVADVLSRSNHTGTQLSSTISDFNIAAHQSEYKILTSADSPYTTVEDEKHFIGLDTSSGDIEIIMGDISGYSGSLVDKITFFKVSDANTALFELEVSTQTIGEFSTYKMERRGLGIEVVRNRGQDKYWFTPVGTNAVINPPITTTGKPSLASTTLTMTGNLLDLSGNDSVDVYFDYRKVGDTTWTSTTATAKTSTGSYSDTATVTASETYEVRAAVETTDGTIYYGATLTSGNNYYEDIDAAKADDLYRYWPMQETSGTDEDAAESLYADDMKMYNGVTISSDTINSNTIYKRVFDGTDYGQVSFTMVRENKYTFLVQVDLNTINGDHTVFSNGVNFMSLAVDNDDIQLSINNVLETWTSATPFTGILNLFITYDFDNWVAQVYEVTGSTATLRITSYNMPSYSATASPLRLGRGYSGDGNHQDNEYMYDGEVRSMAIWERVLTDTEMKTIATILDTDGGLIVTDSSYVPVPAEHGVNASIQNHRDVSDTDPTNEQVLKWNSTTSMYEPATEGGASTSDIDSLRDTDMQLFYLIDADAQAADGLMFDNFNDETQVDTTASTNESYDAAGDFYEGTDTTPSVIDSYSETNQNTNSDLYLTYTGKSQSFTLSSNNNIKSCKFYLKKVGSPTGNAVAKIYAASGTVGTDAIPTGTALATSSNVDVSTISTSYELVEFTFSTAYSATAGDYCITVEYSNGNGSDYISVGMDDTTPTHSGNFAMLNSTTWTADSSIDTCFYLYASTTKNNMTLISESRTAGTSPTTSRLSVFAEGVDTFTINTDLKGYVSEDDGTTWDEVTLEEVATVGTGDDDDIKQYSGDETLTTGTGTTMVWKVATLNNKHIKIHACGQRWRT